MKKTGIPAVYFTLLILALPGCLKEEPLKKPFTGFEPLETGDGWRLSTPAHEGIDETALEAIYGDVFEAENTWMLNSLLVFRHGKLVAESYLKDEADRTRPAPVWSCTKQVTSLIAGIAVEEDYIGSVHDPIEKYLQEHILRHPGKRDITLQDLLTMRSGIGFNSASPPDIFRKRKVENSLDYILGLDQEYAPGDHFNYQDSDPQLVSGIIQAATGQAMDEYGQEALFDPLGIGNLTWKRYPDGVTLGSFGIFATPRDMAKIAQCVLDSGRWNGQQVVSFSWIRQMLEVRVSDVREGASFGYFWWVDQAKGRYFMWGHGGQFVFIIPSKRLLVVMTSLPQVDNDFALSFSQASSIVEKIEATTAPDRGSGTGRPASCCGNLFSEGYVMRSRFPAFLSVK